MCYDREVSSGALEVYWVNKVRQDMSVLDNRGVLHDFG
jgi:hypothetical protein